MHHPSDDLHDLLRSLVDAGQVFDAAARLSSWLRQTGERLPEMLPRARAWPVLLAALSGDWA